MPYSRQKIHHLESTSFHYSTILSTHSVFLLYVAPRDAQGQGR